MPIKIPRRLPAAKILNSENIFIMTEDRALKQDIRPLKIVLVNLMPMKEVTETQIIRLLGNTPLQVEVDFVNTVTHDSKNTSQKHLDEFYKDFDSIKNEKYDGMIITGAPVEKLDFDKVDYWDELTKIMEWSKTNVTSTLHICWAAQAGLYYHYGVEKHPLNKKMFGVFKHKVLNEKAILLRGFDDEFYAPHSRYTEVKQEDIEKIPKLQILATSDEASVYIVTSKDKKNVFVTGHCEYDADTLHKEWIRDVEKGIDIDIPKNYYKDDNPKNKTIVNWRSHANSLFTNWLNYYVYQQTPYVHESKEEIHTKNEEVQYCMLH